MTLEEEQTSSVAKVYRRGCGKYKITSDKAILPLGTRFFVFPVAPKAGNLVLFLLHGVKQVGEWLPRYAGLNVIAQANRAILITDWSCVQLVGVIVLESPLDVCETGRIKPSPESCN